MLDIFILLVRVVKLLPNCFTVATNNKRGNNHNLKLVGLLHLASKGILMISVPVGSPKPKAERWSISRKETLFVNNWGEKRKTIYNALFRSMRRHELRQTTSGFNDRYESFCKKSAANYVQISIASCVQYDEISREDGDRFLDTFENLLQNLETGHQ